MKKRTGFVSNSSSSSFICEICGRSEYGFNEDIADFDMCECENGHIMCQKHVRHYFKDEVDEYDVWSHLPEQYCPICQRKEVSKKEIEVYINDVMDIDKIKEEFKKKFPSHFDYRKYFRELKLNKAWVRCD